MKTFNFRKIISFLDEKDMGMVKDSIIWIEKIPFMFKIVQKEDLSFTEQVVTQYRYRVHIDLWFMYIRFQFLSKWTK